MSAESQLFSILDADSGLAALVSDRIYPDAMPEETAYPAVIFTRTGGEPVSTIHSGHLGDFVDMSVQAWADSRSAAITVDDALTAALFAAGEVPDGATSLYDDETGLFGSERSVRLFVAP